MGSLIGFKYSEMQCNNYIYEEFGDVIYPNLTKISPGVPIFNSDEGYENSKGEDQTEYSQSDPGG